MMMLRPILAAVCLSFIFASCTSNTSVVKKEIKSHFPNDDFFNNRNFPETSFDQQAHFKHIAEVKSDPTNKSLAGEWEDQGPGNHGGRINKIAINPNNEDEIYLGYSRGGLYKTTDGGLTWTDIFKEFSYLSISHIEIDPNDTNTILIGTGDENISSYPAIGNGVYKSTDGGLNWENLGLGETGIISKVTISQQDPNVLYASAMGLPFVKNDDRGVYKSIDGGSSWDQILFVNDSTGIIDMLVAPDNSDIVYASGWNRIRNNNVSRISGPDAKIWKTIDGGSSWTEMENGLPQGEFTRIGLGMFGTDGQIVYASYSQSGPNEFCDETGNNFYGLYKTSDGGDNWDRMDTSDEYTGLPCDLTRGFAWYFGNISVNPLIEDDICVSGVYMHRHDPAFNIWRDMVFDIYLGEFIHVDFHDMVYFGENLYAATDGGAYRFNESTGWVDIENISTNQFYRVEYNNHEPDLYYGGLQDNGVVGGSNDDINNWFKISFGDGFQIRFDPSDPDYVYTQSQNGALRASDNGGQSFTNFTDGLEGDRNWDMQYILSPQDPKVLFTGTDKMYVHIGDISSPWIPISEDLTDGADDPLGFYEHNISCLSQSPINGDYLYCGTTDGLVWRSSDFGVSFEKINDGLPRRYISEVKASPTYEEVVFVTVTGYKNNDFVPHIFRSDNAGDDWIDIGGDLPEFAINDIFILPGSDDQNIFVATEIGVYLTINGGNSWERLGDDFPFVQCLDLEYNDANNELIVGTFGKGLRTFNLSQIDLSATHAMIVNNLFEITPTIASDKINILAQGKYEKLSIIDANGRLVQESGNSDSEIDISHFANGTYFIQVRDERKIQVKKFIKM